MNMIFKNTKRIYLSAVVTGLFISLLFALVLLHHIGGISIHWELATLCFAFLEKYILLHRTINLIAVGVTLYSLFRIGIFLFRQGYQLCKWLFIVDRSTEGKLTRMLKQYFGGEDIRLSVIRSDFFVAVTIGFIRPRIILSSWVVEHFTAAEVEAIVYHEMYHYKNKDTLKLFVIRFFKAGFHFIPIFGILSNRYHLVKELYADQYAMDRMGSEYELCRVLLKLSQLQSRKQIESGVMFATEQTVNYRILQVLEPGTKLPEVSPFVLGISLMIIISLGILIVSGCF